MRKAGMRAGEVEEVEGEYVKVRGVASQGAVAVLAECRRDELGRATAAGQAAAATHSAMELAGHLRTALLLSGESV